MIVRKYLTETAEYLNSSKEFMVGINGGTSVT